MKVEDLIEVRLGENVNEKIVIETLSRIGICNKKEKILYPSCYLIKEDGKYYLGHFKELFLLRSDGYNNISNQDIERRNSIIYCLWSWGLIDVDEDKILPHETFVFILPYNEKKDWVISHKYKIRYE